MGAAMELRPVEADGKNMEDLAASPDQKAMDSPFGPTRLSVDEVDRQSRLELVFLARDGDHMGLERKG